MEWRADGTLGDAGVLLHTYDGYAIQTTDSGAQIHWRANRKDLSASLLYAAIQCDGDCGVPIPIYDGGARRVGGLAGVILRPGASTRVLCGKATDMSGASCGRWCNSLDQYHDDDRSFVKKWKGNRDGCGGHWRPQDFGAYLHRAADWHATHTVAGASYAYNEILVDHNWWNRHLPATIEAFFADGDAGSKIAAADRAELMRQYGLSEAEAPPLVWIDRMNWANPFH